MVMDETDFRSVADLSTDIAKPKIKYQVMVQNIKTRKTKEGIIHTNDIGNFMKLLAHYGWHLITHCENPTKGMQSLKM